MTLDETALMAVVELPPLQEDRLYTAEQAAPYVNVSVRFLKRAAGEDAIHHTRLGRFRRWSAQNIRDITSGVPYVPPRKTRAAA
ncbi:hypothetical protein [Streptomyces xanthochromogenes]|uniref:hypothetical protein n=1 Tax=Streptomyces xanthochromogenes TaxID=67384 RepID=UPI002F40CD52